MWLYLEIGSFRGNQVEMKSFGEPMTNVLIKRGNWDIDICMEERPCEETYRENDHQQAKE